MAFYAVGFMLTGKNQDSGLGSVLIYCVFIAPGLLVALIDWLAGTTPAPVVVATSLMSYGLTALAMVGLLGPSPQALVLGMIGGIPAGVCSWVLHREQQQAGEPRPRSPA